MRKEYEGTLLEQILEEAETRSIQLVYLNKAEFHEVISEATGKNILHNSSDEWFTLADYGITFYLEA